MQEQKVRAREARKALGDLGWAGVDLGKEIPATEFVGYDRSVTDGKILAIVADGEVRDAIVAGADAIVVLDQTTMYAEMGGQVADHGTIKCGDAVFTVNDVQKNKGGKYLHYGKLESGELKVGDVATVAIDDGRRDAIRRAHTATHLLQSTLEKVLGDHVHQAGSLVEPDHLRFDFTHFSAVTNEEMAKINALFEECTLSGETVETLVLPIEEAKKLGATALFGEKYGDTVRVVKMGDISMEFCGGTHLNNTAKVGAFRITGESSVASGVRRIEMITGTAVRQMMDDTDRTMAQVADTIKAAGAADILRRTQQLMEELKEEKRVIEQYKAKESAGGADDMIRSAKEIGGVKVVTRKLSEGDANALRQLGDVLRDKDDAIVAAMVLQNGAKITIQVVCGKEAVKKGIKAGDIIKSVAPIMGGKGGGKPDSAMGGGSDAAKIDEALAAVEAFVAEKLK